MTSMTVHGWVAVVLAAGCAMDETSTAPHPIGGPSAIATATGELEAVVNIGNCSATLISQDTVLTAGHCVCNGSMFPATDCTSRKTVTFTNVVPVGEATRRDVSMDATVIVYPELNHGGWLVNDYALLRLDTRADSVVRIPPMRVARSLASVGQTHTLVGYGGTSSPCDGRFGTKRKGSVVLDQITTYTPPAGRTLVFADTAIHACPGDSGGPALDPSGQIVGVASTSDLATNSNYDPTAEAWPWLRAHSCTATDATTTANSLCRDGPLVGRMYRNTSYGGTSQSFSFGRWDVGDLTTIGNDTISSLSANAGVTVRLWSEAGCWGDMQDASGGVPHVSALLDNRTSCLEVSPGVTLYASPGYGGAKQTLRAGGYNHLALAIGNDQVESLIASPGMLVRACSESGAPGTAGWGTCQTFSGAVPTLGSLDNSVSNVEVASGVTLYRDVNHGGTSQTLGIGVWGASALGVVGNDQVSSLVVGPGLAARLCSENGAWGDCQTYTGSVAAVTALLDDRTSSVEVWSVP